MCMHFMNIVGAIYVVEIAYRIFHDGKVYMKREFYH